MKRTRTITLELRLTDDSLSGSASEGGERREFSGRLGLMRTIDELLAMPGSPPTAGSARKENER